jgi:hypothetical protein
MKLPLQPVSSKKIRCRDVLKEEKEQSTMQIALSQRIKCTRVQKRFEEEK